MIKFRAKSPYESTAESLISVVQQGRMYGLKVSAIMSDYHWRLVSSIQANWAENTKNILTEIKTEIV